MAYANRAGGMGYDENSIQVAANHSRVLAVLSGAAISAQDKYAVVLVKNKGAPDLVPVE